MLNGLDLFSGIGGISLALRDYVRPVAYCEIDPYCQGVLLSRMQTNDLPIAPVWDDITSLDGRNINARIDIIYGGFPCQDISVAGRGKGLEGERSGLFFEIMRLAKEIRPPFIFLENVPAITVRGGLRVVREIAEMGYDCRWCVISAASIGALHRRERWFLLAYSSSLRCDKRSCEGIQSQGETVQYEKFSNNGSQEHVAYTNSSRCHTESRRKSCGLSSTYSESTNSNTKDELWNFESREHWQETVSEMGKCSDGVPFNVDRLRAMGNSVCPQQAKEAFEILMGFK